VITEADSIREVIDAWLVSSKAGDLDTLKTLMTEDVLFLTRNGLMRRDDFVSSFQTMSGKVDIDGISDIQEITVAGDLAVCWNKLQICISHWLVMR
jgi:ketosteroid isomerase-like protein